jgi:hypothetical protein
MLTLGRPCAVEFDPNMIDLHSIRSWSTAMHYRLLLHIQYILLSYCLSLSSYDIAGSEFCSTETET